MSFSGEINKAGYSIESTAQVYLSVPKPALYSGDTRNAEMCRASVQVRYSPLKKQKLQINCDPWIFCGLIGIRYVT